MMYYYPGMGWWMVLSTVFWLVLIGIAVWALVRFVQHQTQARPGGPTNTMTDGRSAEEILAQRYARGEIDEATFERMHQALQAKALSPNPPASVGR